MGEQLLKKHQKSDIRFQQGDFILYEPNKEQLAKIRELMKQVLEVGEDHSIGGTVEVNSVKFIIKEMTSIGDEVDNYTDEELVELLNNGDGQLQMLLQSISDLLHEVSKEIIYNYAQKLKLINQQLIALKNGQEVEELKQNINQLLKQNNIDMTYDDMSKINAQDMENILKKQINNTDK